MADFDPSSATAIEEPQQQGFDPSSAAVVQEQPQQSGLENAANIAQQAVNIGQKAVMALYNPVYALHKLQFPEEAKLVERPLISREAISPIINAITPNPPTFSETGKRLSQYTKDFISEQISGATSPENLALLAAAPLVGKFGGAKVPTISETINGKAEPPISQPSEPVQAETAAINQEVNNAVQEQSASSVLQHSQETIGEAGGGRGRVEPSVQGQETPAAQPEVAATQETITTPTVEQVQQPQGQVAPTVPPEQATTPNIYVSKSDIGEQTAMGGGKYKFHKQSQEVMRGEHVDKEQLPENLYHVTTANDAVQQAGFLRGSTEQEGGLGKGTSKAHQGVSTTSSLEDAKLIEQELRRGAELSRGEVPDFASWLKERAAEDEAFSGLDKGKLDDAVSGAIHNFDVNHGAHPEQPIQGNMFDAYNLYLNMRESRGGQENPLLMGGWRNYAKINPSQINILEIPTKNIPDQALIRKSPIGQDFMHEVMVHSDVPITRESTPQTPEPLTSTTAPLSTKIEPTAATTAEPTIKTEVPSPSEPTSPISVVEKPSVSAVANRFTQERAAAGEIGEVAPGQGFSTVELAARGAKMSPEQINQNISDLMTDSGGDIRQQASAVRAEEARLSQRSRDLSGTPEGDNAFKDLTDFINGPVAKLKQTFHASGIGLQGELPIDLGTFNGLREAWLKDTGKLPTEAQEGVLRKTAEKVSTADKDLTGAQTKLGEEIGKASANRKLPTADEVRNNIIERMKVAPCRV